MPKDSGDLESDLPTPALAAPSAADRIALASLPIDPSEPLERKLQLLLRNLGILQLLDDRAALDLATEQGRKRVAEANSHPGDIERQFSALALKAVLEFLLATGVGVPDSPERNKHREPRVLWRLLEALINIDDRGAVSSMFQPSLPERLRSGKAKKPGRHKPSRYTLAVRAVAAAQLTLRHEKGGHKDLDTESEAVEASLAFLGKEKPTAGAIKKWREALEPHPTVESAEFESFYRTALNYLRRFDSLEAVVARTQAAIRYLAARAKLNK